MRLLPLVVILSCTSVLAQESPNRSTVIRATGNGAAPVRVDQARLRVAVLTTGGTAERARERNAERVTSVIAKLRDLLGPDANIRSANFSVTQKYPDGYLANSTIEAHASDPTTAGKAIDAAIQAGASVIGALEANGSDEQIAKVEALKQATLQARANAEAIAAALGMKVLQVLSAETLAPPVTAGSMSPGAHVTTNKRSVPTPLIRGSEEVRAQVAITVEVAP